MAIVYDGSMDQTSIQSGLLFAGGTALCWAVSSVAFSRGSKLVGSLSVNILRLVFAIIFFAIYGIATGGDVLPAGATLEMWCWLSLSGFVGFFLGDLFLFYSFNRIGVRLSMLLMALAPLFAAVTGWAWLGETLLLRQLFGMGVTIAGVMFVILDRPEVKHDQHHHLDIKGVVCALLGAVGQGVGLVLGKVGMIEDSETAIATYDPFAATQIRAFAGAAGFVLLIICLKRAHVVGNAFRSVKPIAYILTGAFFGPFLGVALLMRSVQLIPSGIAQTVGALVPILLIPIVIVLDKEKVTVRSTIGTIIAISGVAILSY